MEQIDKMDSHCRLARTIRRSTEEIEDIWQWGFRPLIPIGTHSSSENAVLPGLEDLGNRGTDDLEVWHRQIFDIIQQQQRSKW